MNNASTTLRHMETDWDPSHLKRLRTHHDLTQQDVSDLMDVSTHAVMTWEMDDASEHSRAPGTKSRRRFGLLADALDEGYTLGELIDREFLVL